MHDNLNHNFMLVMSFVALLLHLLKTTETEI